MLWIVEYVYTFINMWNIWFIINDKHPSSLLLRTSVKWPCSLFLSVFHLSFCHLSFIYHPSTYYQSIYIPTYYLSSINHLSMSIISLPIMYLPTYPLSIIYQSSTIYLPIINLTTYLPIYLLSVIYQCIIYLCLSSIHLLCIDLPTDHLSSVYYYLCLYHLFICFCHTRGLWLLWRRGRVNHQSGSHLVLVSVFQHYRPAGAPF